jgi:hypothetical protein
MPIESLHERAVELRCINCRTLRTLELDKLELKPEPGARPDTSPAKIDLPACANPGCGSSETLFASPAKPAVAPVPGSYGHLHSLLVDKLAAALVERGLTESGERAAAEHLIRPRDEEVSTFFDNGLVLPLISWLAA